jgi:hypothetical protein
MANSDNSLVTQKVQFGVESTHGSAATVNRFLDSLSLTIQPQGSSEIYAPSGSKLNTTSVRPGMRWVQAPFSGRMTYSQLDYILSSAFRAGTITTPSGGTTSRLHVYDLAQSAADTFTSYTVEVGNADRAQKFNYGYVNELQFEFGKQTASFSGTMVGQALQDDITLTSVPSSGNIGNTVIASDTFDVYFADTQAGLAGATKLGRAVKATFKLSNRRQPVWAMDSSNTSYSGDVELKPSIELTLTLGYDDEGYGPLSKLTGGSTQFIRIKSTGANIEGSIPYQFQLDMAGVVTKYPSPGDDSGRVTVEWSFAEIYDSTWGKAIEVRLQNALAAL